jgi:predicted Zn finger-like uncharacterized protein
MAQLKREKSVGRERRVMILTCPQCSTRYHIEPAALGARGRTVRCASCGQRWSVKPPADTPQAVELDPPPRALPLMPIAAHEPGRRRRRARLIGWGIAVIVALLAVGAVIARDKIVSGFPATAAIYQRLGLPVAPDLGLQFEDVTSARQQEGGIPVLVVEGAIVNTTGSDRPVPPIRITLLDGGGRELQGELFRAKEPYLEPGAKTRFSGRVVNPADQARNFSVTFQVDR